MASGHGLSEKVQKLNLIWFSLFKLKFQYLEMTGKEK